MTFRPARAQDIPAIMEVIAQAQAFLAQQGIDQWQDGYPDVAIIEEDIRLGRGYVLAEGISIAGIASILFDGEPTYDVIREGAWHTPEPYAAIHRVAVNAAFRGSGIADTLMQAAEGVILNKQVYAARIDTHPQNVVMQRMLLRNGYLQCGSIYLQRGAEAGAKRIALEKALSAESVTN